MTVPERFEAIEERLAALEAVARGTADADPLADGYRRFRERMDRQEQQREGDR